jgi:hypothetical protein
MSADGNKGRGRSAIAGGGGDDPAEPWTVATVLGGDDESERMLGRFMAAPDRYDVPELDVVLTLLRLVREWEPERRFALADLALELDAMGAGWREEFYRSAHAPERVTHWGLARVMMAKGAEDVGSSLAGHGDAAGDAFPAAPRMGEVFAAELAAHSELFLELERADLDRLARQAAARVVSSLQWSKAVGERWSTEQVCELLGVTRQALASRRKSGSLIALEGTGTSWYPTWQFDAAEGQVRPVVLQLVGAFREALDERATPRLIASWATTPNVELGWVTPATWIVSGGADQAVVEAAEQDAWAEAR